LLALSCHLRPRIGEFLPNPTEPYPYRIFRDRKSKLEAFRPLNRIYFLKLVTDQAAPFWQIAQDQAAADLA
jgi:hypothetical protein